MLVMVNLLNFSRFTCSKRGRAVSDPKFTKVSKLEIWIILTSICFFLPRDTMLVGIATRLKYPYGGRFNHTIQETYCAVWQ